MSKHYIGPVGRRTGSLSASLKQIACLVGWLLSGTRLVGRTGSAVWVSAIFNIRPQCVAGQQLQIDQHNMLLDR